MSSRALFRNPTWRGLRPGLPTLDPAAEPFARKVREAAGRGGTVHIVRLDAAGLRFARIDPDDGSAPLFVKIVPKARASSLAEAEALARWLAAEGQPVNAALPDYPRRFDGQNVVFAYLYREGRRVRAEQRDLAVLGTALAGLHGALARHPDRRRFEAATDARFEMLRSARLDLASGRRGAGPDPDALRRLAEDDAVAFEGRRPGSTPIHDDLNPGNLLMAGAGESPFFLDFEDALHGVLPPVYDVAVVLERAVLVPEEDDGRAVELGRTFLEAFGHAGGGLDRHHDDALVACLRGRALRALCTLALCEWDRVEIAHEEWRKFFFLETLARERAAVLRRIWRSEG